MRSLRWAAGLMTVAVVGACATVPRLEDAAASLAPGTAATLQFFKGYQSRLMVSGSQSYFVSTTTRCEDLRLGASLLWTEKDGKVGQVAAGQPITVLAATVYYVSTGYMEVSNPSCYRRATFTPVAGHQYRVISNAPLSAECDVRVTDLATNQTPADLVVQDGAKCLRDFQREQELNKSSGR